MREPGDKVPGDRYGPDVMRFWLLPCVAFLALSAPAQAGDWETLAPGIRSQPFLNGAGRAFEVDLQQIELRVVEAREHARSTAPLAELVRGTDARLAVNGGFFDGKSAPLGLLVSGGKRLNRLRKTDWGVFYVTTTGEARVVHTRDFDLKTPVEFAIQAGPRLVVDDKVLQLKPQWDRRTALGIRDARHVVIAVVSGPVLLATLAEEMRTTLQCPFALNLDGGSSTQLWSALPEVTPVLGFSVANAVIAVVRPTAAP